MQRRDNLSPATVGWEILNYIVAFIRRIQCVNNLMEKALLISRIERHKAMEILIEFLLRREGNGV
jgi:hypothetical protein